MRRVQALLVTLVLAVMLAPTAAQAQRRPRPRWPRVRTGYLNVPVAGVRGGYDFDTRSGSVGGDIRIPLVPRGGLLVVPSGDVYFNEGPNDWQLNLDGELRPFPLLGLYGGGGGALIHHAFTPEEGQETKAGWNLFAGLQPCHNLGAFAIGEAYLYPPLLRVPFAENPETLVGILSFATIGVCGPANRPRDLRAEGALPGRSWPTASAALAFTPGLGAWTSRRPSRSSMTTSPMCKPTRSSTATGRPSLNLTNCP